MNAAQAELPFGPADPDTQAILDLIAGDPCHRRDRAAVVEAIRATAKAHHGQVNPNAVRPRIPASVQPRVIGATYNALAKAHVIAQDGWVKSTDAKGRNSGRPVRCYRWIGGPL